MYHRLNQALSGQSYIGWGRQHAPRAPSTTGATEPAHGRHSWTARCQTVRGPVCLQVAPRLLHSTPSSSPSAAAAAVQTPLPMMHIQHATCSSRVSLPHSASSMRRSSSSSMRISTISSMTKQLTLICHPSRPILSAAAVSAPATSSLPLEALDSADPQQLLQDVQRLQQAVQEYRRTYYAGAPTIDDDTFDSLLHQLEEREAALRAVRQPKLLRAIRDVLAASPLKQVGTEPSSVLQKYVHARRMLSLAAITNGDKEALLGWGRCLAKSMVGKGIIPNEGAWDRLRWSVEPKMDGLASSVTYRDGRLVDMATRGDGAQGENVTHNAPHIQGLLQQLHPVGSSPHKGVVLVRGEVYVTHDDHQKVNAELQAKGRQPLANPRNAAAGGLRLIDPTETPQRRLSFMAYEAVPLEGDLHFPSQEAALQWCQAAGLAVNPDNQVVVGFDAAVAAAEAWMQRRSQLGYEVDGAVLKLDDTSLHAALGVADTDPRWAVAWKFPTHSVVTRLLGVDFTVGRTGQVTPVARLEPAQVGGVVVSQATLHNLGQLQKGGYRVGDSVVLHRAGDVIPYVECYVPALRPTSAPPLAIPRECPSCSTTLVPRAEDPGNLVCPNTWACPAQQAASVQHFVASCAGNGLGTRTVERLRDVGLVNTIADLFKLTKDQLLQLDGIADKKADTVLAAIDKARHLPLGKFLVGLGIHGVGKETCTKLGRYATLAALDGALPDVPGLTRPAREGLTAWFQHYNTRCLLNELRALRVGCAQEQLPGAAAAGGGGGAAAAAAAGGGGGGVEVGSSASGALGDVAGGDGGVLEGLKVVVTGTLVSHPTQGHLTREGAKALLMALGASPGSAVNGKTDWLVTGEKPGSNKLAVAAKHGVRVLHEYQFWEELQNRGWDPTGRAAAARRQQEALQTAAALPPAAAPAVQPPAVPPQAAEVAKEAAAQQPAAPVTATPTKRGRGKAAQKPAVEAEAAAEEAAAAPAPVKGRRAPNKAAAEAETAAAGVEQAAAAVPSPIKGRPSKKKAADTTASTAAVEEAAATPVPAKARRTTKKAGAGVAEAVAAEEQPAARKQRGKKQSQEQQVAQDVPLVGGLFPADATVTLLGKFQEPASGQQKTHKELLEQLKSSLPEVRWTNTRAKYVVVGSEPGQATLDKYDVSARVDQVQLWKLLGKAP